VRERERLDDFRGGHVACRGCKRLILFQPGELLQVRCCEYLYSPEQGVINLIIYDRLEPGEAAHAQVAHAEPVAVIEAAPGEDWWREEPAEASVEPSESEIDGMAATAETIAARRADRVEQVKRRSRLTYD
jgi:hypothetical protein